MAYTAPRTWVLGELVSASMMNTWLRDNVAALYNKPRFKYRNTAAGGQSIPASAASPYTTITYDTQDWDVGGGSMSGSAGAWTGVYTPQTSGVWLFECSTSWASSTAAGQRSCWICAPGLDGANYRSRAFAGRGDANEAVPCTSTVAVGVYLAGQTVRCKAFQTTAGALSILPSSVDGIMFAGNWLSF